MAIGFSKKVMAGIRKVIGHCFLPVVDKLRRSSRLASGPEGTADVTSLLRRERIESSMADRTKVVTDTRRNLGGSHSSIVGKFNRLV
jgi:hypothetical protein